jgi:hypothetical protein
MHAFLASRDLRTPRTEDPPASEPGVWLLRPASGVGVIIPVGVDLIRNGVPVVGLAVLHHGEKLEFADRLARFREIQQVILGPGSRLIGRRCPLCHVPLREKQTVIRCPLCGEGYCIDCWEQLTDARCCSRNCQFSPGPVTGGEAS